MEILIVFSIMQKKISIFSNFDNVYLPRCASIVDVERETEYCNKLSIIQQHSFQRNILIIAVSQIMIAYFDRKELCFGSKFSVLNFRWFYLKRFLGIHAESHIKIRFELNRARQNSGQNVDGSRIISTSLMVEKYKMVCNLVFSLYHKRWYWINA